MKMISWIWWKNFKTREKNSCYTCKSKFWQPTPIKQSLDQWETPKNYSSSKSKRYKRLISYISLSKWEKLLLKNLGIDDEGKKSFFFVLDFQEETINPGSKKENREII